MRRLAIVALLACGFGAGVVAGQAYVIQPSPDPFFYHEGFDTAFHHRLAFFHSRNDGGCMLRLYRGGLFGGRGELVQVVDVRICQWLQQK